MSNEIAIIQKARNLPRVRDLETGVILSRITASIGKVFITAGQVPQNEEEKKALKADIQFMASELTKDVEERYAGLTIEEIVIALEKGVRKDFGKYYGLNVVTFNDWLSAYAKSHKRSRAIAEQIKMNTIPAPIKLTPEQLDAKKKDIILIGLNLYKKMGSYPGRPDTIYDALVERGLINLSESEKWDIYNQAQKRLIGELEKRKREPNNFFKIKAISNDIELFLTPNTRSKERIIFEAKKVAINNFYKNIIENDIDINELVNPTSNLQKNN